MTIAWPGGRHATRRGLADAVRPLVQALLLFPLLRWACKRLVVRRPGDLGAGPYVVVANHSSHADTALVLRALPRRLRRRTAVAAAADHFFVNPVVAAVVRLLVGAFPFPRRGSEGIARARALLASGTSVVVYPEGTRAAEGRGRFRRGVGELAAAGYHVVPVGIAGAVGILPKGAIVPRRRRAAVVAGEPMRFERGAQPDLVAARLQERVRVLAAEAEALLAQPPRRWFDRAASVARGRTGVALACAWGIAEALVWPLVPDVLVAPLAAAVPGRFVILAAAAAAGSVVGGVAAFGVALAGAGDEVLRIAPLVTERMATTAAAWMDGGAHALLRQPLSGIPYKVFALQAPAAMDIGAFVVASFAARAARLLAVAAVFALAGAVAGGRRERSFGAALVVYSIVFAVGLSGVVRRWS